MMEREVRDVLNALTGCVAMRCTVEKNLEEIADIERRQRDQWERELSSSCADPAAILPPFEVPRPRVRGRNKNTYVEPTVKDCGGDRRSTYENFSVYGVHLAVEEHIVVADSSSQTNFDQPCNSSPAGERPEEQKMTKVPSLGSAKFLFNHALEHHKGNGPDSLISRVRGVGGVGHSANLYGNNSSSRSSGNAYKWDCKMAQLRRSSSPFKLDVCVQQRLDSYGFGEGVCSSSLEPANANTSVDTPGGPSLRGKARAVGHNVVRRSVATIYRNPLSGGTWLDPEMSRMQDNQDSQFVSPHGLNFEAAAWPGPRKNRRWRGGTTMGMGCWRETLRVTARRRGGEPGGGEIQPQRRRVRVRDVRGTFQRHDPSTSEGRNDPSGQSGMKGACLGRSGGGRGSGSTCSHSDLHQARHHAGNGVPPRGSSARARKRVATPSLQREMLLDTQVPERASSGFVDEGPTCAEYPNTLRYNGKREQADGGNTQRARSYPSSAGDGSEPRHAPLVVHSICLIGCKLECPSAEVFLRGQEIGNDSSLSSGVDENNRQDPSTSRQDGSKRSSAIHLVAGPQTPPTPRAADVGENRNTCGAARVWSGSDDTTAGISGTMSGSPPPRSKSHVQSGDRSREAPQWEGSRRTEKHNSGTREPLGDRGRGMAQSVAAVRTFQFRTPGLVSTVLAVRDPPHVRRQQHQQQQQQQHSYRQKQLLTWQPSQQGRALSNEQEFTSEKEKHIMFLTRRLKQLIQLEALTIQWERLPRRERDKLDRQHKLANSRFRVTEQARQNSSIPLSIVSGSLSASTTRSSTYFDVTSDACSGVGGGGADDRAGGNPEVSTVNGNADRVHVKRHSLSPSEATIPSSMELPSSYFGSGGSSGGGGGGGGGGGETPLQELTTKAERHDSADSSAPIRGRGTIHCTGAEESCRVTPRAVARRRGEGEAGKRGSVCGVACGVHEAGIASGPARRGRLGGAAVVVGVGTTAASGVNEEVVGDV